MASDTLQLQLLLGDTDLVKDNPPCFALVIDRERDMDGCDIELSAVMVGERSETVTS